MVLPLSFYERPALTVAEQLIGCYLVRMIDGKRVVGKIVETEAYLGTNDRAAHTYSGRPTKRTEAMFGPAGRAYVYKMHTHHLLNVVTDEEGIPHGVLIRAVEPLDGIDTIKKNRHHVKRKIDWTNGPGKLTKAFHITMDFYNHRLDTSPLFIEKGERVLVEKSKRVGIKNSGEAAHYLWRFSEVSNPYVSKYRP